MADADVPAWWQALGIPGLFDVHVHFLPPRVMAKVRAQFDAAGPLIGRPWPIRYRGTDEELVGELRDLGVRRFSALSYAHRPEMAESLNDWAPDFAARTPELPALGDVLPRARRRRRTSPAGSRRGPGLQGARAGGRLRPPRPAARRGLGRARGRRRPRWWCTPAPDRSATEFTGPGPVEALLRRHPRLPLVIAHMGAPEYAEFLALAEEHAEVRLDTTMAFTDFFSEMGGEFPPAPAAAAARTWATRCCSAPTSRTSPTPTPTSSRRSSGSGWATTGCARCAGATPSDYSKKLGTNLRIGAFRTDDGRAPLASSSRSSRRPLCEHVYLRFSPPS